MKNIMVFDDCQDYFYDIHSVSSDDFALIFPAARQNVEFHDDLRKRLDNNELDAAFRRMWYNRRSNLKIEGLHGMLFYENFDRKPFYPDKHDIADAQTTFSGPWNDTGKVVIIVDRQPNKAIVACYVDSSSFASLFKLPQQDVLFFEDLVEELGLAGARHSVVQLEKNIMAKPDVNGINGTLYIGYPERRIYFVDRIDANIPRHYPRSD